MKILQICKKVPWPHHDGESIAVYAMAKGLTLQKNEVSLLAMNTTKHEKEIESVYNHLDHYSTVNFVSIDNKIGIIDIVKNLLFSKDPIHVDRLNSKEFELKLLSLVEEMNFDVILMETLFSSHFVNELRLCSNSKLVIRNHNVEHLIWTRLSKVLPIWKRWYYTIQANRIRVYEKQQLDIVDLVLPLSDQDERNLKNLKFDSDSVVIPIGLDFDDYIMQENEERGSVFRICFIGSLDWEPNLQGLNWFIKEVWSKIVTSNLGNRVELHIAGKQMPLKLKELSIEGVVIHQEVTDALSFINNHDAMIVPLFAGSGQRVKILQAMALGKVVLSSSIGIEGIHAEHEKHFFKCNTVDEYLECIREIVVERRTLSKSDIRENVKAHHEMLELGQHANMALLNTFG